MQASRSSNARKSSLECILLLTVCIVVSPLVSSFSTGRLPFVSSPKREISTLQRVRETISCQRSKTAGFLPLSLVSLTNKPDNDGLVPASDLEALQALFSKYCDDEGLMTKKAVSKIPAISDLLVDGDLLEEEFNDIWSKVPKFPDVSKAFEERIDVDSFVQLYRDIDDLFEDEVEKDNTIPPVKEPAAAPLVSSSSTTVVSPVSAGGSDEEEVDKKIEDELESIFESLADKDGLVSKQIVREWDEVKKLLDDGLLGDDEFQDIWDKTKKSPGSTDKLDVDGFLSFNVALDSLFEFDDDEMMEDESDGSEIDFIVKEDGQSPEQLFEALAGESGLVARDDLKRWAELNEMIDEGDLLPSELDAMFAKHALSSNRLDKVGFVKLYKDIDDLFEEEETSEDTVSEEKEAMKPAAQFVSETKTALLDTLEELNSDDERLPCGLEASEREQGTILKLVNVLENEPSNLVRVRKGALGMDDFAGTWELLYSSSSAMKFNKGLSGLGGSFPNGRFGGLTQKLETSKFITDVEYVERINVTPAAASFDVFVKGDWELRQSVSLFTGEPSIILTVTPDRVIYGPTSTRADHWKSLGPLNMLDVAYLDDDLRIMRGSTSVDTIFIFRRLS